MGRGRRTQPPRPPVGPPATAGEGAARVRELVVKLFARKDGEGVDWSLIAESLFKAAFDVLDRLPEDQKQVIARRVHAGSYDRIAGNASSKTGSPEAVPAPSNAFDLKSSPDGPSK